MYSTKLGEFVIRCYYILIHMTKLNVKVNFISGRIQIASVSDSIPPQASDGSQSCNEDEQSDATGLIYPITTQVSLFLPYPILTPPFPILTLPTIYTTSLTDTITPSVFKNPIAKPPS